MQRMFLSFSVVSDIIRWWSVLPRHLQPAAICATTFSALFPYFRSCRYALAGGPRKSFFFSPGPNPLSVILVTGTSISSPKHSDRFWGPRSLIEYQGLFTRRWSDREADRWFISNVHCSREYIFCIVISACLLINIFFFLSQQSQHSEHCAYISYNTFRPSPGRYYNDMDGKCKAVEVVSVHFTVISTRWWPKHVADMCTMFSTLCLLWW